MTNILIILSIQFLSSFVVLGQKACASNPCENGGTCTDVGTDSFECTCQEGFKGTTCTGIKGSIVARHRKAPHSLNILGCRFINFKTPAFKLSKSSSTGCLKKNAMEIQQVVVHHQLN